MDYEAEFTLAELIELENAYKELREESLNPEFWQAFATSFSFSNARAGKTVITPEQVRDWFIDKVNETRAKHNLLPAPVPPLLLDASDSSIVRNAPEAFQNPEDFSINQDTGKRDTNISELTFEAKSAKDCAWYDVACFRNYRVMSTGEILVLARFAGFRNVEDEWVNVRTQVRQRSIPLESSECHTVEVGNPVLCFREREEQAVYFDARIVDIQRRDHDEEGCRCIFTVCYEIDNVEEQVELERLCCRPT